jgi:hypothetical protein
MFGRTVDRALRASEERYEAFIRALNEDRKRFDQSQREDRERFEAELEAQRRRFEREMERRYRDEVRITREFMRRNELVMSRLVEKIEQLTEDSKAQTRAILQVVDRLQNGGEPAGA